MERNDVVSSLSQRISLGAVGHRVNAENRAEEAACERSAAVDHVLDLLTLQICSLLQVLLGNISLYVFNEKKVLEWNAVKRLQFTAPAFHFAPNSLCDEGL